jgi:hypothetical protein
LISIATRCLVNITALAAGPYHGGRLLSLPLVRHSSENPGAGPLPPWWMRGVDFNRHRPEQLWFADDVRPIHHGRLDVYAAETG